ncbi:MAG: DUF192 domain-containing protein [Candidatus Moranbacteria bacterium]|nr:DUF192 domain-containing protein [Candidatus Moranbacteria bacterium]
MLNKKKHIAIRICFLLAAGALIFFASHIGNKIANVEIGGKMFHVEIVKKDADLQKGLGDREGLCESCGMLFEFSAPGKYSFWMKNMRFDLDIIWIRDHEIVHIEKNVHSDFKGILTPIQVADTVLEIKAGSVDGLGIKIGDKVVF